MEIRISSRSDVFQVVVMRSSLTTEYPTFEEVALHADYTLLDLAHNLKMTSFSGWVRDPDFRIANGVYMVYTRNTAAGDINPVATRILMDQFLLESVLVSDNIDVGQTCPRGAVVFCVVDPDTKRPMDTTIAELRKKWYFLFREGMPYNRALHDFKTSGALAAIYRSLPQRPEKVLAIATKYLCLNKPKGAYLTAGEVERVYNTIHGAMVALLFAVHGFSQYNIFSHALR